MIKELAAIPLWKASDLLKRKEVSPVDLVETALSQMESMQPRLNAFITVLADEACKRARALEDQLVKGEPIGPLQGIPVALKDLFFTKGIRTTAGSKILEAFVPDHDSAVAERLRDAGAVLLGKTNTHEFAFGATTASSHFGPTTNPWDASRIPGGSSGGSGAAVAAGMAYAAMGTDTGGSVRIPASMCGVVGFKPSYGAVSLFGVIPLSFSFDHAGPLTRCVEDAALVFRAISGYDERDPFSRKGFRLEPKQRSLKGLRIGVYEGFFAKLDPEVESIVRKALDSILQEGADRVEVDIPRASEIPRVTSTILFAEAAWHHRLNLASRAHDYQPDVRKRLDLGSRISAQQYIGAVRDAKELRRQYDRALETVDVLVMPTVPIPACEIGRASVKLRGSEEPVADLLVRNTRLGNLAGAPCLSLPCGFTSEGLPVGLQVMGKRLDDEMVLSVGCAIEACLKGKTDLNIEKRYAQLQTLAGGERRLGRRRHGSENHRGHRIGAHGTWNSSRCRTWRL